MAKKYRKGSQKNKLAVLVERKPLMGGNSYSGTFEQTTTELTEASLDKRISKSASLAWDETEALNMPAYMRNNGNGMSDADRKEVLYQAYMRNPWISSSIDAASKRLTSGGLAIEEVEDGKGNDTNKENLKNFFEKTNEEWDFLQFIRSVADDIQIYGEAYAEIVWQSGTPVALYKIDCPTMSYALSKNGQIMKYTQKLANSREVVDFSPEQIIRWWLPSKRANMVAESPIERLLGPVGAYQNMETWTQQFFRKGSKPPFWIKTDGTEDEARRFITYMKENYTGINNAQVPIVTFNGAEIKEYNKSVIDVDFEKGSRLKREEILAVMSTPPAMVSLIETGNIGSGSGLSQNKTFQYNNVAPLHRMIFEKLNYRVTKLGFKIEDWKVTTHMADYRDDLEIAKVQDTRIRNGLKTINETRTEMGEPTYEKGGDTAIFVNGATLTPVELLESMVEEHQQDRENKQQLQQRLAQSPLQSPEQDTNPPFGDKKTMSNPTGEKQPVQNNAQQSVNQKKGGENGKNAKQPAIIK